MKLTKTISLKKQYLKYEDLEILCELLKSELSLHDSLGIIRTSKNKELIKNIISNLDKGKTVSDVFIKYLNNDIKKYFMSFISYMSFKESLSLAMKMHKKENDLKNKIIKEISYPAILMIITVIGIFLFNEYCFDILIGSIEGFNTNVNSAILFKEILDVGIKLLLIFIIIISILFLFFSKKKRIVFAYIMLDKYMPNSIFKEYLSSRFVLYFNECHKIGLKTKDSINILKSFNFEPLVSFIAFHVDNELLSGKNMIEAMKNKYIDDRLSRFIKIAINTSELNMMLDGYIAQFERRFKNHMNKLSLCIQLSSYVLIGVVIIFVYQILFIPISMIGGL